MTTRLMRNTFLLMVGNAGSALLALLLSILIGRVLGETGIGAYGVVMAWIFPARLLAEFGLGTLITRDVAAQVEQGPDYLRATMRLRWLMGGGGMLAIWLAAPWLSQNPVVVAGLRISAPLILIEPFFGAYSAIFRAEQRMWPLPVLNIGMLVAQVGLTALVLLRGAGILAALWVNVGTSAAQLVAAWLVYQYWYSRAPAGALLVQRQLLRRAWPFALAAVLATLQTRLGIILLERLTDTAQAGYFTVAGRFVEAARLLPMAYFNALLPALAALASEPARLRATFGRALVLLVGFGGVAGFGGLLLADPVMMLAFGPAFAPAVPVLQLALWGLIPALLRGGLTLYWYAQGREVYVNRVLALAVIVQLGCGFWLVPRWGALGAALAALVAEGVGAALLGAAGIKKRATVVV